MSGFILAGFFIISGLVALCASLTLLGPMLLPLIGLGLGVFTSGLILSAIRNGNR